MNIWTTIVGLALLLSMSVAKEQPVTLLDMIPIVSQLKSAVQFLSGDKEGASATLSTYLNNGLGPAQLRSGYFLVTGDVDKAIDIQKTFAGNMEVVADGMPIVGHVKGLVHLLANDTEHGWRAIKSATANTAAALGGIVAGPPGAIGAQALADLVISGVDATANRDPTRLHGIVDYVANVNNKRPGEHFDAIAGLMAGVGGGSVKVQAAADNKPGDTDAPAPRPSGKCY